ncbi:MAG: class I SAM-dependent RNA methyltransferase [Candidatus Gracilibacteria bacterium]
MQLIATCAFGLEKLVYDELKKLGLWVIKTEDGRVTFEGDDLALVRANLWLRCADRVQIKVGEFRATTFDELFDQVNALPWENYINVSDAFPVDAVSVKSMLHSEPAIQSITKKSIVKRLQQKYGTELLPENSGVQYQIMVKSNKDDFVVTIDSSGDSLHKRGYRMKTNEAPMKETLAAAIITLSGWTPDRTLVDPFCGSGTICIEAALMAHNMAPGLKRTFAFQKWPWISQENIQKAYAEAREAYKPDAKFRIYGFDIDADVLTMAGKNAGNAGFNNLNFKRSDFAELDWSKFENCTFITNPPYGERLEEIATVEKMYHDLGKKFKETVGCSMFLITAHEKFQHFFGRVADKNRKLFNGGIKCYLFSYLSK